MPISPPARLWLSNGLLATILALTFQVRGIYMLADDSLSRTVAGSVDIVIVKGSESSDLYAKLPGV